MNNIELERGRNMDYELNKAKDIAEIDGDEELVKAIELVMKKVVYPMIDKNV